MVIKMTSVDASQVSSLLATLVGGKTSGEAIFDQLLGTVDLCWYEFTDVVEALEALSLESGKASLLLSKIYFHLERYNEAIRCALQSGHFFDLNESNVYVRTIVARAIDLYVEHRKIHGKTESFKSGNQVSGVDSLIDGIKLADLEILVNNVIETAISKGELFVAVGTAIEAQRIDLLEKCILSGKNRLEVLQYALSVVTKFFTAKDYLRTSILSLCERLGRNIDASEIFRGKCLVELDDAESLAKLLNSSEDSIATQIAHNIAFTASPTILAQIQQAIISDQKCSANIQSALAGSGKMARLAFMHRSNLTDHRILEKTRAALSANSSMHQAALSIANGMMHCGTANDSFLRANLEWLSHATNWAKFSAAASLGIIHHGSVGKGSDLLKPYLPQLSTRDAPAASSYQEGGALFALGLIGSQASHPTDHAIFISSFERAAAPEREDPEVLLQGACFGMGASHIGTGNLSLVDEAKGVLYRDEAVSGEGAAICIGLILSGHVSSGAATIEEILQFARVTAHEKTVRALGMAAALACAGCGRNADNLISVLISESDPLLRHGGVWAAGSAYCGTGDREASAILLKKAVSDESEDVRRASVIALGLVYCREPHNLPPILGLLIASHSPHVRFGAAIALGIAFAGTGDAKAIAMLRPLVRDFTDFCRQAALVALSLVLQLQNNSDSDWARELFASVASTRHEDATARFGAILAQGLIDVGGRCAVFDAAASRAAIAGTVLFTQFWFWYPLTHFGALAIRPKGLVCLASDGTMPKFAIQCNGPQAPFIPPPPLKDETVAPPKKLVTAVLSTAAKAAARARRNGSIVPDETTTAISPAITPHLMEVDLENATDKSSKDLTESDSKVEKSKITFIKDESQSDQKEDKKFNVCNMDRVTLLQAPLISWPSECKYQPVCGILDSETAFSSIIVVKDVNPEIEAEGFHESFMDIEIKDNSDKNNEDLKDLKINPDQEMVMMDGEPIAPPPFPVPEI